MATMTLGLSLSLFTIAFTFTTFKKGLDPDVIVYPIMSTIMDVAVTIFYITMITLLFTSGVIGKLVVVIVGLLPLVLTFYIIPRNMHDQGFFHMIKESFLTVILVAFIVNVAGIVLKNISSTLIAQDRREIYTVYPALTATIGNIGSMVGSVTTTKLALGLLKPSFRAIRAFFSQIIAAWFSSILFFVLLSFLSLFINNLLVIPKLINLIFLLLIVNIVSVGAIVLFSYGVSFLTFKRGLNPDNFVIPIESSLADTITSIVLLWALYLMF
jgi:mgtE-like transporter